ncbi:MAG TPA: ABC transporter permease [Caulobacteraceae bacterium]|jgi:putative ABC transport system permease protein|nr:ABC transporter permease [Caulobacteraceae bacterium]
MMSLALATLIYEWRRYLAAVIALAFSGMMVLAFSGLFAGIIHSDLATWERSRADLIILPANVKSLVNSNSSLPSRVKPLIYLHPEVVDVEPISSDDAQWVNIAPPGGKQVTKFVQVFGIEPTAGSVTLPTDYTEAQRIALMEPGAVAIDETAQAQLGVKLGDKASLNGQTVYVRALLHNYQSAEQPIVVASHQTMRQLGMSREGLRIGPLMVSLKDPKRAELVRDQLNAMANGAYRAWTLKEFNQANEQAVMGQQIIGLLLGFSVFLAGLIGIGVTSQTLRGAILSNIREFASLRALGISMGSLRMIVMELSFWVGVVGLFVALGLTAGISLLAGSIGLPIVMRPPTMISVSVMLIVIAIVSGAMAMGILKKSQPADLLR